MHCALVAYVKYKYMSVFTFLTLLFYFHIFREHLFLCNGAVRWSECKYLRFMRLENVCGCDRPAASNGAHPAAAAAPLSSSELTVVTSHLSPCSPVTSKS